MEELEKRIQRLEGIAIFQSQALITVLEQLKEKSEELESLKVQLLSTQKALEIIDGGEF